MLPVAQTVAVLGDCSSVEPGTLTIGEERKLDTPSKQPLVRLLRSVSFLTGYVSTKAVTIQ